MLTIYDGYLGSYQSNYSRFRTYYGECMVVVHLVLQSMSGLIPESNGASMRVQKIRNQDLRRNHFHHLLQLTMCYSM